MFLTYRKGYTRTAVPCSPKAAVREISLLYSRNVNIVTYTGMHVIIDPQSYSRYTIEKFSFYKGLYYVCFT